MERVTSISTQSAIQAMAGKQIDPPSHVPLDDDDMPFFRNIVLEFAKSQWSAHQLELAAMLARMMNDLDSEQRKLRKEGTVMFTEKGTPVVSPRKTVVQMLSGSILSMRRSLALHACAQGETHNLAKSIRNSKMIESDAEDVTDDLIARP
jgi:hypothetical protein